MRCKLRIPTPTRFQGTANPAHSALPSGATRRCSMDLIVEGRGAFVGKHQGRLRVTREGKVVTEAPLIHLEHVLIVDNGVSISSDAVRVCAEEGIPIHFIGGTGHVHAGLYSAGLTGTVLTRRAQLAAYDSAHGMQLALAYVRGKLENQINLL